MNELSHEEKVKEVSVADGYVYIDLLCGLRLSAPIMPLPKQAAAAAPVPSPIDEGHPLH